MIEKNKKTRENKSVIVDGVEEWISRSVVVIPFVFRVYKNDLYFLTEKRGEAVSHAGEYCGPCGFLDYGEDLNEACSREVREETGLDIDPNAFIFLDIFSKPEGRAENIGVRFINYQEVDELPELNLDNVETKGEVVELFWKKIGVSVELGLFSNKIYLVKSLINDLKWAFGHDSLIVHMLNKCNISYELVDECPKQDVTYPIANGEYECIWGGHVLKFLYSNMSLKTDVGIKGTVQGTFIFKDGYFIEKSVYDRFAKSEFNNQSFKGYTYSLLTQ